MLEISMQDGLKRNLSRAKEFALTDGICNAKKLAITFFSVFWWLVLFTEELCSAAEIDKQSAVSCSKYVCACLFVNLKLIIW